MTENQEMTPEEMREKKRENALNLIRDNNFRNLALAYMIENGQGYGEQAKSLVDMFIYQPALASGEIRLSVDPRQILGTRQEGRRYTENVSMYSIMRNAAGIFTDSLSNLTVNDLARLSGHSGESSKYDGQYLSDMLEGDQESQAAARTFMGIYQGAAINDGLLEARTKLKAQIVENLEAVLNPQEDDEE